MALTFAPEVAEALDAGRPVVALESTLLAHGLPSGRNLTLARGLGDAIRAQGAVPATIAVLDGAPTIGLSPDQLGRVCTESTALAKLSARDLGPAIALGRSGATTVAATSVLAHRAGIRVFATGGLGGVHLPAPGDATTWDVSADLGVLATTPLLVVCSGVKSVLDIAATLEVLEARSVPVLGYRTDDFPAFYLRSSGHPVPWRVDDPGTVAATVLAHREHATSGAVLANPVPPEHEMERTLHDRLLAEGLDRLRDTGASGSDVTPVLLEHFHTASGGISVATNEALVLANATLAAQVAVTLSA
ncbi:pseudouridine-5'-phosphate glycosidase [Haloechinothrix halophila]|uniref:pseudouridine-5'-phosphate glycosidase n=1 Tax=Haloechinothrix halophila TaxID=1069073 RepID=UPI0003F7A28D|nr:pseudouridine-5'-phosphate glycosidase [Haloechinothrix halophila]